MTPASLKPPNRRPFVAVFGAGALTALAFAPIGNCLISAAYLEHIPLAERVDGGASGFYMICSTILVTPIACLAGGLSATLLQAAYQFVTTAAVQERTSFGLS